MNIALIVKMLTSPFRKQYSRATTNPFRAENIFLTNLTLNTQFTDYKNCCIHLSQCVHYAFYLKGPQAKLNKDPGLCSCVFWQEGKHHVVHPKQWDEKQSRFGQPPAHIATQTHEDIIQ